VRRTAGSVEEFQRFFEKTAPRFLGVAYAILGDRAAAEDALQVALLRTYRHWSRARENPGGYSWRVLVNVCRNELRRRGRLPEIEGLDEHEPSSPGDLEGGVAGNHDLLEALCALPYHQREVVVLRYYLELSVSETAHVLEVPEGTVKSMSARALVRLKWLLTESDGSALPSPETEVHDVEQ
jgi:RNA polymerase sigma-70 factor (sigma-E family)